LAKGFKVFGNVVTYGTFSKKITLIKGNCASRAPHGYARLFEINKSKWTS
jgi:hypothetical protein